MKSRTILAVVALIAYVIIFTTYSHALSVDRYNIDVLSSDTSLSVHENIYFVNSDNDSQFLLWIQKEATNLVISANGETLSYNKERIGNGDTYRCDIASINDTNISIFVTYNLPKTICNLDKVTMYNVSSLIITYDKNKIFEGNNLKADSNVSASFIKKSEPVVYYPVYVLAFLTAILAILLMYSIKKKSSTVRKLDYESPELLNTKKALLMTVLKEIEKKHRSKDISDDTYNHLKEYYKQEAVEVMKRLEKENK